MIQVNLESEPEVDPVWALDPNIKTEVLAEFAEVDNAKKIRQTMDGKVRRMERSGSRSRF